MIEVVRRKSKEEKGVEKAISNCSRKFLDKTFSLSNSKVIICTGKRAETMIKEFYTLENKPYLENIIIGKRNLLFIPHPNARGQKKLSFLFLDSEIEKIKLKF